MSREEALKIWLPVISMGVDTMVECKEALNMAIKALEQEPCENCVDRNAVIEITAETGALETQARVKALPPVTPKQRTGKWELTDDEQNYRCSYCKNHWISASEYLDVWKYCPNCGAKMKGERANETNEACN